ncbi:ImmA/IrrE family metallo-endopeptidase [Paenibacillus nicotianae]|uniref:ImmA/IrrE family metallo-endopeptidase n=1 Tax=Paenibacillus nicotianae TaxID=1526551 RepID=A0ABW4UR59_9BACL
MSNANAKALQLIKKCNTNDPYAIAEAKGIVVLYEDLGSIWGYFHLYKRIPIIHINNRLTSLQARFTLSHEIGHYILHKDVNTPYLRSSTYLRVDRIESEANTFAVRLLVGTNKPFESETEAQFMIRCGIPLAFTRFYKK